MLTIIGLMSGTSADGIDAALVSTDGQTHCELLDSHFAPYRATTRQEILQTRAAPATRLADVKYKQALTKAITEDHVSAVKHFLDKTHHHIDFIGFHGQTVFHDPKIGRTIQLGDGAEMARSTAIDTVYDFRRADMDAGGQGAPLAPIYHQFLVKERKIPEPACIINIGGVANLTYIDGDQILGFDIGPGNGLMDELVARRTGKPFDNDGALANAGKADQTLINAVLSDPFFDESGPKSLDWGYFLHYLDLPRLSEMTLNDSLASLCQITAKAIHHALATLPRRPASLVITGGGRHNQTLMRNIEVGLPSNSKLLDGSDAGLETDMMEAELIAFLTARHHFQLPSTFPETTGVDSPQIAGVLARATTAIDAGKRNADAPQKP